jgi:predicted DNA-binding transcriptional regulator AlpA
VPRFLTVDDLSELLGIPKRTIYGWRQNPRTSPGGTGGPVAHRFGRILRFAEPDVVAWLATVREDASWHA